MRDLGRAMLIALCFLLLPAPAAYGGTAQAFAIATALLVLINVALVWSWPLGDGGRRIGAGPASAVVHRFTGSGVTPGVVFATVGAAFVFIACRAWLHQILTYPNDSLRADMLIVIQQGIRRILQGRNPYAIYQVPWDATLPYGPVLWAPFVIPHVFHADLRFVSIAGALFIPVLCAIAASALASVGRYLSAAGLLLIVAVMAFSPDLLGFSSIAHTPSYWPLLVVFACLVARERWYAAAITAGLLIVARTTMIAVAPVLLIAVWHRDRRRTPGVVLLLIAATALPYLPFAIWDGKALWFALYGSYQQLMKGFVWTQTTWVQQTVGVTGLLLRAGYQHFAEGLQVIVMLAVYGGAWRSIGRGKSPSAWMAAALFAFSLTTFWPVHYIYFDVFLLWTCALVAEIPWPPTRRIWPAWTATFVATAAVLFMVVCVDVPSDPTIEVGIGATRSALYRGFSNNEGDDRTFAWIDGTQAEMLVARRSRSDASITLVCQPHLPTPGSTQQLSVALNGMVLGNVPLAEGWHSVTFDAPAKAWQIGINQLSLSLSTAVSPRETGTGDDDRKLSMALDRLTVRTR